MSKKDEKVLTDVSSKPSVPAGLENSNNKDILDYLFSNRNRLMTSSAGSLALPKDTQGLIAYFSGGEIIISRTHRYDGRVIAFMDLLHQKNLSVKQPFYSDLGLISTPNLNRKVASSICFFDAINL